MRSIVLALGFVVLLGLIGAAGDGSVAWPVTDDSSGAWPNSDQMGCAVTVEASPITCALACLIDGGCQVYPGVELNCTCLGGQVCCLYLRCLQNPWWMILKPCYCGTEIECTGIPCIPGQPLPTSAPAVKASSTRKPI